MRGGVFLWRKVISFRVDSVVDKVISFLRWQVRCQSDFFSSSIGRDELPPRTPCNEKFVLNTS
ncbi:TPA_asm: hypothetical protein [Porphyromonas phage phage024a_F0570]|uniref:Uncharacterized protein n=1 Tax=Porphyromonas phage phage024a_F0570 TaxID=3154114 RepID=A0AAT9J8V5_9CAUD